MRPEFVHQGEARRAPELRGRVGGDRFVHTPALGVHQPVLEVLRTGHWGMQRRCLGDDAKGFLVSKARLLPIGGGGDHLSTRDAFRADGMQQREHRPERCLPIPAADLKEDGANDPATVVRGRPVDAADDPLLPRIEGKSLVGPSRLGMTKQAKETHRPLAVPMRIRDFASVEQPGGTERLHGYTSNSAASPLVLAAGGG